MLSCPGRVQDVPREYLKEDVQIPRFTISPMLRHTLLCYPKGLEQSKPDPLQQLVAKKEPQTLITRNHSYKVAQKPLSEALKVVLKTIESMQGAQKNAQADASDAAQKAAQEMIDATNRNRPQLPKPQVKCEYQERPIAEREWSDNVWYRLEELMYRAANNQMKDDYQRMDDVNKEIRKEQTKQREARDEELKKANEAGRWGTALMLFSWITAATMAITGLALIATGVGVVAGCMLLAGGLIQIGSQILEVTGGWQKIKALLPGDDEAKRQAILSWIQIGIAVFSLILCCAGMVAAGFATFGQNMQKATALMGAIAIIGTGVSTIGQGIVKKEYKYKSAEIMRKQARIDRLKDAWQDHFERQEEMLPFVKTIYDGVALNMELSHDYFRHAWTRR